MRTYIHTYMDWEARHIDLIADEVFGYCGASSEHGWGHQRFPGGGVVVGLLVTPASDGDVTGGGGAGGPGLAWEQVAAEAVAVGSVSSSCIAAGSLSARLLPGATRAPHATNASGPPPFCAALPRATSEPV
jgi:hypothetical protein